jgi:hypothetical protein
MIYKHPITQQKLRDVNEFADIFHDEIIDPFEMKTGLKVIGWNDNGISVGFNINEGSEVRLSLWFVLKILNDWKER